MTVSEEKPAVRVRFPPSPTGPSHVGGARTALYNWLFARQHKGIFVLRIEDTDPERSAQQYEIEIIESLRWLGLDWDEGPDWKMTDGKLETTVRGEHGPYRQSERRHIYEGCFRKLLDEKKAYYCYCTKEELEAERQEMIAEGLPPKYGGHCRELKDPPAGKTPQIIRFRTPEAAVAFKDLVRGHVAFDAALFGDMAIARIAALEPGGFSPLYNFAVVVDDETMNITHVIRGEEHLSNTPKQILIQKALGFREPIYAHLPLILAPDRSKLSKRYMETSILRYRDEGYLPEAMVNFLALLGWHPKDNQEIFSLRELVEAFDVKRVQKAGAIFDQKKLEWLNGEYLRRLSVEDLTERIKPFVRKAGVTAPEALLRDVVALERERLRTLGEFPETARFFFELSDYPAELLRWKDDPPPKTKTVLEEILGRFKQLAPENFDEEKLLFALSDLIDAESRGSVLWPLRVAVSGKSASPDPLAIITVLGKEETLRRITVAVDKIGRAAL